MKTSIQLQQELAALEVRLSPLLSERQQLNNDLRKAQSVEYIAANSITKANTEPCNGPDRPWFGVVYDFGKWLKENSNKQWAIWNGRVYRSSDLILGRMPDSPACEEDLK